MSDRTGIGLVGLTILRALERLGAQPDGEHVSNRVVLAAVQDAIGLAPGYGYGVHLARSWATGTARGL